MRQTLWIGVALLVWGLLTVGYINQQKTEIEQLKGQLSTCQAAHRR